MKVFLVWGWDAMASNHGEPYLAGVYATEEAANAERDRLNAQYPKHQYAPQAHVTAVDVKV